LRLISFIFKKNLLIFFLVFSLQTPVSFGYSFRSYGQHIGEGIRNSFDNPSWLAAAGVIALSCRFDKTVQKRFRGKLLPEKVSFIADQYGKGYNWLVANVYIIGEGVINDRPQKETFENLQTMAEAYFVNAVFTYVLKFSVRRKRPGSHNRLSFPSGHTSGSFVVAATLNQLYGKNIGIPAFLMASVTGLQRIHKNKHWLSDVLAGALLGTLVGNGFGKLKKDERSEQHPIVLNFAFQF